MGGLANRLSAIPCHGQYNTANRLPQLKLCIKRQFPLAYCLFLVYNEDNKQKSRQATVVAHRDPDKEVIGLPCQSLSRHPITLYLKVYTFGKTVRVIVCSGAGMDIPYLHLFVCS